MKIIITAYLLLFASIAFISCKKKNVTPPQNQKEEDSLIVRIHYDIIQGSPAVFLVNYDADRRIKRILDSIQAFTSTPSYDGAGNMISIRERWGSGDSYIMTFSYNTDNQLTQIDSGEMGQYSHRYVFEYANGILSKKSLYTRANLGPDLSLFRYFTYEVTNGNITKMRQYNSANRLEFETTFTYTSYPNIFKPFALLNYGNGDVIGLGQVAKEETFFNKNLIANSTTQNNQTTFTYTYDNQRLRKFMVGTPSAGHTRFLSY
jgi:hypothetical protein